MNAQGDIVLPAGEDFLRADFLRAGPDLLIETLNGTPYVVSGFFMSETPPALVNTDGAVLSARVVTALAGPIAPGQVAQLGPNTAGAAPKVGLGQPIGQVSEATGSVTVTHPDGSQNTLVSGGQIYQGDVLQTGAKASVSLVFADDTVFSLAEDARMVLDEMVYDPDAQTGVFSAQVVSGVFSFVSGQVAKTSADGMVVMTPTTTIGIRGSTAMANAAGEGTASKITLVPDVDGHVGELSISTRAGVQVLNQPNASTTVTSAFAPPSQVVFLSPQEVQKNFGSTFTTLTKAVAKQAQVKADEAQGRAANAQAEAQAAKAEADQAKDEATQAEDAATKAEAEAEAAKAEAEAAQAELEAAKADGNAEAIAAAEAKVAATQAKADQALAQAETAKVAAQKAVEVAAKADTQATAAQNSAQKAQAQAEHAQQFSSQASTASKAQAQAFAAETKAQAEAGQKTAPDDTKTGPTDKANTKGPADTVTPADLTPDSVPLPVIVLPKPLVIVIAPLTTPTTTTDDTTTTTTTTTSTSTNPSYSGLFSGTTGVTATLLNALNSTSGQYEITATVTGSGINDTYKNVKSFTASAGDDTITLTGLTMTSLNVGSGQDLIYVDSTTRVTTISNSVPNTNYLMTKGTENFGNMNLSGTTFSGLFHVYLNLDYVGSATTANISTTTLTVNSSTSFDTSNTIQFGTGTTTGIITSDDGVNLTNVTMTAVDQIILDSSSNTAGATLTLGSQTLPSGLTITGSGDDFIQMAGTTLDLATQSTTVSGISKIVGTAGNDTLTVNQADLTSGMTLDGGSGSDTLTTPDATLNLSGMTVTSFENITTTNGTGTTFTGTSGNDTFTAGSGADVFVFAATAAANGNDTIYSFTAGTDKINVDAFATGLSMVGLAANTVTITAGTVYYLFGQSAGVADSSASVITAINNAAAITDAAATAMLVISDDNSTAVYQWAGNAGSDEATGDTFTLMGTLNTAISATGDVIVNNAN